MDAHPLTRQLSDWGEDVAKEFERASHKGGRRSPSDIAEFREEIVRDFISNFFPFPYRVAKGVIRDINGTESASVDAVLLNPIHPFTAHKGNKASLILADGVEAAVEIKSDSTNVAEIASAFGQVQKTKFLRRVNHSLIWASAKNYIPIEKKEIYENYYREVPTFVFFAKMHIRLEDSIKRIGDAFQIVEQRYRPDFVVINGAGIIVNERLGHNFGYDRAGTFFEQWRDNTMAGFLLFLNLVPSASLRAQDPFLKNYLEPLRRSIPKTELGSK